MQKEDGDRECRIEIHSKSSHTLPVDLQQRQLTIGLIHIHSVLGLGIVLLRGTVRKIVHVDRDAFYASVLKDDPREQKRAGEVCSSR